MTVPMDFSDHNRVTDPSSSDQPSQGSQGWQPAQPSEQAQQNQPPLLVLLASSHPRLSSAIETSVNAYQTGKHYSPAFLRAPVERVERVIESAAPAVVQTVDLDRWLRSYLTRSLETPAGGQMPPSHQEAQPGPEPQSPFGRSSQSCSSQQRPVLTTAALSASILSQATQARVNYSIALLERTIHHINGLSDMMQIVLTSALAYRREQARMAQLAEEEKTHYARVNSAVPETKSTACPLVAATDQVQLYQDALFNQLRTTVTLVNHSLGAALPSNVGAYVRRQLLSLPGRWKKSSESQEMTDHSVQQSDATSQPADPTRHQQEQVLAETEPSVDPQSQVEPEPRPTAASRPPISHFSPQPSQSQAPSPPPPPPASPSFSDAHIADGARAAEQTRILLAFSSEIVEVLSQIAGVLTSTVAAGSESGSITPSPSLTPTTGPARLDRDSRSISPASAAAMVDKLGLLNLGSSCLAVPTRASPDGGMNSADELMDVDSADSPRRWL